MPSGLEYIAELQSHIVSGTIKILFDHDGTLIYSKENEARRIHQYLQEIIPTELQPSFEEVSVTNYGYKNIWAPELTQILLEHNPARYNYLIDVFNIAPYFIHRLQLIIKKHYPESRDRLLQALEEQKASLIAWLESGDPERFKDLTQVIAMFLDFSCPENLSDISEKDWLSCLKDAWANRLHKKVHINEMDAITIDVCRNMKALPGTEALLEHLLANHIDVGILSGNYSDVVYTAMNYHFPTIACPYPRGKSYAYETPSPHCSQHVSPHSLSAKKYQIRAMNNHYGIPFAHKPDPKGLLLQLCSVHHTDTELQTNPQEVAQQFLAKFTAGTLRLNYKTVYIGDDLADLAVAENAHFDYFIAVETGAYRETDFQRYYHEKKLTIKLILVPNLAVLHELLLNQSRQESKMFFKLPAPIPFQFHVTTKKDNRITVQLSSPYDERLNAVCFVPASFDTGNNEVQACHLVLKNKVDLDAGRSAGEYASPGGRVDLADAGLKDLEKKIKSIITAHGNDLKKAEIAIQSHVADSAEILKAQWEHFQHTNQTQMTKMNSFVEKYKAFTGGMNEMQVDYRQDKPVDPWTFVVMEKAAKREAKEEALISLDNVQMVPINRKYVKSAFDTAYTQRLIEVLSKDAALESRQEVKALKLAFIREMAQKGVETAERSMEFRSVYFIGANPIHANQHADLQRCCGVGERAIYSAARFVPIGFNPENDVQFSFKEQEKRYVLAIMTRDGIPCRSGGEFYAMPIVYDELTKQQAFKNDAIPIDAMPVVQQVHPIAASSPLITTTSGVATSGQVDTPQVSHHPLSK